MFKSAWDGIQVVSESMKERVNRPKNIGMTMVIDTFMGTQALQDVLEVSSNYIDHWKYSYGTSALIPEEVLYQNLKLLDEININTFPGGTLLEAAIVQKNCQSFMLRAKEIGFRSVEISDGTILLTNERRKNAIICALYNDLIPITEVGKKDPLNQPAPNELAEQILQDLDWGAECVIVDARESGCGIGIFDSCGELQKNVLSTILSIIGDKMEKIIWEAPLKKQQIALIKYIGSNVNLGNVKPHDVLPLESLRLGLQYETLQMVASKSIEDGKWNPSEIESNNLINAMPRLKKA